MVLCPDPVRRCALRGVGCPGDVDGGDAARGPALPADTTTGEAQLLSDWAARGGFFIAIGQVLSVFLYERRPARARRLDTLRTDRTLRRALDHDELTVHYQPVYEIRGRRQRLVGAEALLRWQHPRQGLLGPGRFIEIAEDTGRIREIGDTVLRTVAHQLHEWDRYTRHDQFVVGVNVSGVELEDPHLAERFQTCLADTGADPNRLGVEITETAFMTSADNAQTQLAALQDLGIHIAVDDFGTGYSSLAYVHRSRSRRSRSTAASPPGSPTTTKPPASSAPSSS